jgi:autotransporter-associated beta strand protein
MDYLYGSVCASRRNNQRAFVTALGVLIVAPMAFADTTTTAWNGGTVNWATAANWASGSPSATISALFNSTFANQPQLTATATAQGLYLANGVGQDVTITGLTSARTLNITGTATLGGQANAGIMLDDTANHNLTVGDLALATLNNSAGFYVNNAGTLTFNGTQNLNLGANALTLGGANAAGTIIVGKLIAGNTGGSLIVNTAGTVTLSGGVSTYPGGITLIAGTLNINAVKVLGTVASTFTINGGIIDNTSGVTIINGVANPIIMNSDLIFKGSNDLNLGTGTIALGGATRIITVNAGTLTLGGIMANGGLTKNGAGVLVLSGANTYTSPTTVNAGVLRLSGATALPGGIGTTSGTSALTLNGGVVELANGNFLRNLGTGVDQVQLTGGISGFSALSGPRTVNFNNDGHQITWGSATFAPATLVLNETTGNNPLNFTNAVDLGASMRTVAVHTSTATMSGMLSGAGGGLTKIGAGTLALSNTNTFSGGLTIKRGQLNMNSTNSFGLGMFTLGDDAGTNDAKLYMSSVGNNTFTNPITICGGTSGTLTMTGAGNFNYTFSGPMALNNSLVLGSTQCRYIFSGLVTESDSSALTINRSLGHGWMAFSGGIVVGSKGLTLINSNLGISSALEVSGGITGTGNLTLENDCIANNGITLSIALINNIGTIVNVGTNVGAAWISAPIGPNVTGVIQSSTNSPLILSGANTYNAPTTINAGSLFVNGTNTVASGTGTYTVNNGGTLGGSGKIDLSAVNGSVIVNVGGKMSPGSAVGLVGTSTFDLGSGILDLSAAAGTPGTLVFDLAATNASDQITLTSGNLDIGIGALNFASFKFTPTTGFMNATNTYTLIRSSGVIVGSLAVSGLSGTLQSGITGTLAINGNDLVLNLSGVEGVVIQPVTWKGNMSGSWDFATTNWVATGTTTPAYYVDGDVVTFDDSAAGNFTVSGNSVTPASVIVSNSANAYTLSASIAGSGTLTKKGTGTLNFNNASANTFSGGLNIQMGTVFGATAQQNFGTGTISLGNGDTNSATLSMSQSGRSFSNPITTVAGSTGLLLIKCNGGNQTFYFNGPITLNSDLALGASDNSNDGMTFSGGVTGTGNLILKNDVGTGALTLNTGGINMTGAITNKGSGSNTVTLNAPIGANVKAIVQNSASSKLILSGTNNVYAGITMVSLGTLETQKTNSLGVASSVVIAATGAQMFLNFNGTNTINALKIGTVNMKNGVYGVGLLQPSYFSGSGALKVTTGPSDATMIRFF